MKTSNFCILMEAISILCALYEAYKQSIGWSLFMFGVAMLFAFAAVLFLPKEEKDC